VQEKPLDSPEMSDCTPVFKYVWDECPAKNGEKLILLAIALFCDDRGDGWVAPEMLQAKTGMTRRNIARCIDRCVAKGWLEITQEQKTVNGRRFARHYRIPVKSDNLSNVGQFVQDSDNLSKKSDNLSPHNNTIITSLTGMLAPVASQPSLPPPDIAPNPAPKKRKPSKAAPHPILRSDLDDQAWFRHLSELPEFAHAKIAEEYGRCRTWCRNKGVGAVSRRRFINWLGKVEKPLGEPVVQLATRSKADDYYDALEKRVGGIKA
jgi:hypothetical protein